MLRYLHPKQTVPHLADINIEALRDRGIRGLLLDLDNTIVAWNSRWLEPRTIEWIEQARGGDLALCLLTNAAHDRAEETVEPLDLPLIAKARKPMLRGFRRALQLLGTLPGETAMVGDQLFTDVLGANLLGIHSILIQQPNPREQWWMKGTRRLERWIMNQHHFPTQA